MYILKGFHKLHERGKKTHAHRKKIQVVHKYYCDQIQINRKTSNVVIVNLPHIFKLTWICIVLI